MFNEFMWEEFMENMVLLEMRDSSVNSFTEANTDTAI